MRDMELDKKLKSLLLKSGLKKEEADLYLFAIGNPGCSIADFYKSYKYSKSNAYRAFDKLKSLELITSAPGSWETSLKPISLSGLIRNLENKQRNERRLITELKTINQFRSFVPNSNIPNIETLRGEQVYDKYLELSEMDFSTNLVFGNWESFNNKKSLIPLEKNFIQNRAKKANCLLGLVGNGPHTKEITDYDTSENRVTKMVKTYSNKPIWINAFEGNNLVYIWNLDNIGDICATLIDSKTTADFYKDFIYSSTL
ncbi:MAG: hypothetical protein ACD_51C00208G0002 [uncultured bacterium]|nr:MAG: hypothetical protein ACD_51C00208G0002 [uncultured bacterium]KKT02677.1 MAG: hypothetical protein UV80_C0002G0144 [Candidatus Peregrinibacteria bacterium GW2011_GWF2_43_17]KKT19814.1 MAG: hypothetical protein UW03_C0013G0014 [Candidatus Peregrinibacteria bacterium GW2011_GWA2_43_8]HAU39812.1 hypothetical protein [Candidatus Peregrinibacteria bacterium]